MKTIAKLSPEAAYLLKGRLEAERISAFVLDEHGNAAVPVSGGVAAGLRVQVADEDAERAKAIVRTLQEHAPAPEAEPEKFVSSAQPILTIFHWLEIVFTIIVVVAALYYYFSS